MLTVVKRTEEELLRWLGSEVGFISTFGRHEDQPIRLEPYQRRFLEDRARFRWVAKARQVGFSFLMSIEALARCHLRDSHVAVFVSFSLDEAKERVGFARQIHEELPLCYQKKLVVDSKTELAFESNGPSRRVSRILSVPSKAPRGKRGDLYLDELAHYLNDRDVYRGSTALILRSPVAQLTGCSTPLGRRGVFWEIATEEVRKYPHHSRHGVPWWCCRFFSRDPVRAAIEAPAMTSEERVERFGKPPIVEQFESLALEDFQQELELAFCDDSYSFYPYDLILPCTSEDTALAADVEDVGRVQGRLVAGFDVGRTRDRSELALFDEAGGRFTCRLLRTFSDVPFAEQEAVLRRMLEALPIARLSIDQSGIGMHLAENLGRDYPQVVPEVFANESKERWATGFKILLQRHEVVLPRNRDLVSQIHSIKKRVLPSGKVTFDAERTTRGGHADRFWAVVLACQRERERGPARLAEVGVRVVG